MVKEIDGIRLHSIEELAKMMGLTVRTLRGWFQTGRLKGVKLGKHWYLSEDNLKKFLNAEDDRTKTKKRGGGTR